jgi:hypothetical protein
MDLPIICTLTPDDLRQRQADLLPGLIARAEECVEVADGYRLRFPPTADVLQTIVGVIDTERTCCQFLKFQLTVEPGLGPVWLEVTGPPGTSGFLQALVAGN